MLLYLAIPGLAWGGGWLLPDPSDAGEVGPVTGPVQSALMTCPLSGSSTVGKHCRPCRGAHFGGLTCFIKFSKAFSTRLMASS